MSELDAVALAERLSMRTPTGIAKQIQQLITEGAVSAGTRLPTVRDLAQELEVSVGTIAQAWGFLREEGVVETRRRGGTRVVEQNAAPPAHGFPGFSKIDLLLASPDPSLLPPLDEAVAAALRQQDVHTWARAPITRDLQTAAAEFLPYHPQGFLAVGGGSEGLFTAVRAAADEGLIAVETPVNPGVLEASAQMGMPLIGVESDDAGALPASLQAAVDAGATVFVCTPSGAFGRGHLLTEERAAELAEVLRGTTVTVIEDDPLGPLAEHPGASLGRHLPEQTARVLACCRAFGLDLRTAVLAGPRPLIDAAAGLRAGGLGSVSRILQHTLAGMLTNSAIQRRLTQARHRYSARRESAAEALRAAGLTVHTGPSSWQLWVEVPDEQQAALALSAQGVVVGLGSSSYLTAPAQDTLQLSISQLPEDAAQLGELAEVLTKANAGTLRPSFV